MDIPDWVLRAMRNRDCWFPFRIPGGERAITVGRNVILWNKRTGHAWQLSEPLPKTNRLPKNGTKVQYVTWLDELLNRIPNAPPVNSLTNAKWVEVDLTIPVEPEYRIGVESNVAASDHYGYDGEIAQVRHLANNGYGRRFVWSHRGHGYTEKGIILAWLTAFNKINIDAHGAVEAGKYDDTVTAYDTVMREEIDDTMVRVKLPKIPGWSRRRHHLFDCKALRRILQGLNHLGIPGHIVDGVVRAYAA